MVSEMNDTVEYTLERIGHDGLERLLDLYRHLHGDEEPVPPERLGEVWDAVHENDSFFVYFAAAQDGIFISSCALSIIPNLTRGGRPFGVIENVVTRPEYRRSGIGTSVMLTAIDHARERGCYKILLMSGREREGAHRFYERLGFSADEKKGFFMKLAP